MGSNRWNKPIVVIVFGVLVLTGFSIALQQVQKSQDTRSRATQSTVLSLFPGSNATSPLVRNINEQIKFDVMMNPGVNSVSNVRLIILYDPLVFSASAGSFIPNSIVLPQTIEGPLYSIGQIAINMSIGSDVTMAINQPVKVGTLSLSVIGPTQNVPTSITFSPETTVLSIAAGDNQQENVLASTVPAYIIVGGAPTPTITPSPTPTNTPTATPTIVPSPTITPSITPTPSPTPKSVRLSLIVGLHGIGTAGDIVNPIGGGNMQPFHRERLVTIEVFNRNNILTKSVSGQMAFNSVTGKFTGLFDVGHIPSEVYTVRIKTNHFLRKVYPGITTIVSEQTLQLPYLFLIAGDANNDNRLSILDYQIIYDCFSGIAPPRNCADPLKKATADITDDGNVNEHDYNLFLRELSIQEGQ